MQEQDFHSEMPMPELSDTDILVWFGDFNYRIDTTYDQAIKWISEQRYDMLLIRDQLRVEMTSGRTFPGMREAGITFPPTYKFDRGSQGLSSCTFPVCEPSSKLSGIGWLICLGLRDNSKQCFCDC